MRVNRVVMRMLACALLLAPGPVFAQSQVGGAELVRARALLERSRAELSSEQWALLSSRLIQAEVAYAQLITLTGGATVATKAGAVAGGGAATAGARALAGLSAAAELLPLLMFLLAGDRARSRYRQETAASLSARSKFETSLKELAHAARQIESERSAKAHPQPRPPEMIAAPDVPTLEKCLKACEGNAEAREAFCRNTCHSSFSN